MHASAHEAYLETQVLTATPQRLRLMLVEGAIRRARAAQTAFAAGDVPAGIEAAGHCRNIVTELIAGIRPEDSPLARQVLSVYMFLFSTLIEAQASRDPGRMRDVVCVLEEERTTWQAVCAQMPDRPIDDSPAAIAREEMAPQRVAAGWSPAYGPATVSAPHETAPAFTIDA